MRDMSRYPQIELVADPRCKGWLIQEGPQQHVVRWANGNETAVVANWVRRTNNNDNPVLAAEVPVPASLKGAGQTRTAGSNPATGANRPKQSPSDDLVERLKDCEPRRLEAFARLNDVWDDKYGKLPNPGLVRMNVINRLRAKIKKGHVVEWPR